MIHPSDLLRSDSRSKQFSAPISLRGQGDNDWGIYILPCLGKVFNWKTFAKPLMFTIILSLIGFIQGFLLFYFRNTSEIWSRQYGIPKETAEWIIYVNEFFVGLVALPVSYWGSVTHKIRWISIITICHAIFSISMFIPERMFATSTMLPNTSVLLCGGEFPKKFGETNIAPFIYIMIYQLSVAFASVAFYSLGLVYMDDNLVRNRAGVLAIALASRLLGQQFGIYGSWIPNWCNTSHIFRSYIWQFFCFLYVILTIGIAMFPRTLPSQLIKRLAASLIEIASGSSSADIVEIQEDGFFTSLKRIVSKRPIRLCVLSAVAMESAMVNFGIFENYFKQSKFSISDHFDDYGFNDSFSLNFVVNVMEQPLSITCLIIAGLVISRKKTKVKYLILWNIAAYSVATILFCGNIFSGCESDDMTQLVPSCSIDCGCTFDQTFNPVCLKGRTYYSPCHAGCRIMERFEDHEVYKNCTCASFEGEAIEGSCHFKKCELIYQISQVNKIIIQALLGICSVTNIIILLNLLKGVDKSLTMGLQISLMSLIPFLPVRWLYQIVAEKLCGHWYKGKCRVYSAKLSAFLSNATILLMVIATIIQMMLLCSETEELAELERNRKTRRNSDISSRTAASVNLESVSASRQIVNESMSDIGSLGDDHDSDESTYLNSEQQRAKTTENSKLSPIMESHL